MSSLPMWRPGRSWEQAEQEWDNGEEAAREQHPIKTLKALPNMPGITSDTAKGLKWKALYWMVTRDHGGSVRKQFFRHPLRYTWRLIRSALETKPYLRDGDLFLYGVKSAGEFEEWVQRPNTRFVLGFSYCHKPHECPSGRFSPQCIADPDHPVCRQCFIGKARNALPEENTRFLCIPTIHYIASKIYEEVHNHPDQQVIFVITACEMTLEMFGDWGNMVGIKGLGIRLDGRICNTMRAFELSERGVKPGLTVVLSETQKKVLQMIRLRRTNNSQAH